MQYKYKYEYEYATDTPNKSSSFWKQWRAWQFPTKNTQKKSIVMLHELDTENSDHDFLINRYYEEVRRILFKASNLPEANQSTICLERTFKRLNEKTASESFFIITNGWYTNSLSDLFSSGGKLAHLGKKLRKKLEEPAIRSEFWQSISSIANLLQRLQYSKMICPPLTLNSLVFLAKNEYDYSEQQLGIFRFQDLRLIGLEQIVPFGNLVQASPVFTPTLASAHISNWSSLAEVVIEVLFGLPPNPQKKIENCKDIIYQEIRKGKLSNDEFVILDQMLNADAAFSLGHLSIPLENLCCSPQSPKTKLKPVELTVAYSRPYSGDDDFAALIDNCEFGQEATDSQINKYISKRIAKATVLCNPTHLEKDKHFTVYFDCGDGLWFEGRTFHDDKRQELNSKIIYLTLSNSKYSQAYSSVPLSGTKIQCLTISSYYKKSSSLLSTRDWADELKQRVIQRKKAIIKDQELKILATLELANQLESLMAFLTLFVCQIEDIQKTDTRTTITLVPLKDEMLVQASKNCMEKLTKIKKIQDDIREIINQEDDYASCMRRYLQGQHDQYSFLPPDKQKSLHLLITNWNSAGSLSVNVGSGSTNLDLISWKIDWELFFNSEDNQIKIYRRKELSSSEEEFIKKEELVSVRTRGHYGQMEVIKRRTDAFDHLKKYNMLLKQLIDPQRTSAEATIPQEEFGEWAERYLYNNIPDPDKKLDENKMAIIEDAYCTMPLFALQGPPGTGKSETVCSLVKLIFSDDPMTQILLTSRENATVKELLRKLYSESNHWAEKPIFKLSEKIQESMLKDNTMTDDEKNHLQSITMENQAISILTAAQKKQKEHIAPKLEIQPLLTAWKNYLDDALAESLPPKKNSPKASKFQAIQYLIEQSANFIFTTASDKGLAKLVTGGYMYDWSFVEEAGKTPFYDLILPMLVSQRWMLLGDPQQLEPFQSTEFAILMSQPETAVKMLQQIKEFGVGKKEYISLNNIEKALSRKEPREYFERDWILPFKKIYEAIEPQDPHRAKPTKETAAVLNVVYRMPPTLTRLVNVFYEHITLTPADMTSNKSIGELAPSSSKANPLTCPSFMQKCNGIWINTPSNKTLIQNETKTQVWNPGEAKLIHNLLKKFEINTHLCKKPSLAILTPYRKQVREIRSQLKSLSTTLRKTFTPTVFKRSGEPDWVSTIDAFQGCQADIVIISLVRNSAAANQANPKTIQFVSDENRANVMISRAQRLLIIVGSFDYFDKCYFNDRNKDEQPFYKFLQKYKKMTEASASSPFLKIINFDSISHHLEMNGE